MSKRRKVEFSSPEAIRLKSDGDTIDWSKCFICQRNSSSSANTLSCPFNKVNTDESAIKLSYRELAEKIVNMERIGQMPSMASNVNLAALKDGCNDLASSLFKHRASIHKNCRAKFNDRMQQRVRSKEEDICDNVDETPNKVRRGKGIID